MTVTALDTCRIVWWTGHVHGRFAAVVDGVPPVLAGEARFERRGDAQPRRTPEAVAALDALVEQLREQGWTLSEEPGQAWFERVLTRPAVEGAEAPAEPIIVTGVAPEAPAEPEDAPALDGALLADLRGELRRAQEAVERERQARLEAEAAADAASSAPEEEPLPGPPPAQRPHSVLLLAGYALAVALTAAVFAVGFGSRYSAAVAALTVGAVCLGVDSALVARRR